MKENKTDMTNRYPIFEWIPGIPIMDSFNSEHIPDKKLDN